jgi:phage baseplate assembly protein W
MYSSKLNKIIYHDIDLDDFNSIINIDAIKTSLTNIILCKPSERPYNNKFGSRLHSMLFAQPNAESVDSIKRLLEDAIMNYEPRILNPKIIINSNLNSYEISIDFKIKGDNRVNNISLDLSS